MTEVEEDDWVATSVMFGRRGAVGMANSGEY